MVFDDAYNKNLMSIAFDAKGNNANVGETSSFPSLDGCKTISSRCIKSANVKQKKGPSNNDITDSKSYTQMIKLALNRIIGINH